uniref:Uncharacterized protein n=1 Tax=Bionectria ochroleuca TaxID=29856 RepID=A0A0B7K1I3_BIOOC
MQQVSTFCVTSSVLRPPQTHNRPDTYESRAVTTCNSGYSSVISSSASMRTPPLIDNSHLSTAIINEARQHVATQELGRTLMMPTTRFGYLLPPSGQVSDRQAGDRSTYALSIFPVS